MGRIFKSIALLATFLALTRARTLMDLSDKEISDVVKTYMKQAEEYPLGPHKDPVQVAHLLNAAAAANTGEPAQHVQIEWVNEQGVATQPIATVSLLQAVQFDEEGEKQLFGDPTTTKARRLNALGSLGALGGSLVQGATNFVGNLAQQQLQAANRVVGKAFGVFDDADRALQLNLDAEYNRTIAPLLAPLPNIAIQNTADGIKLAINITAAKNQLLNSICAPAAVTPPKRIPTRYVGPSATLNLVPASCAIEYNAFNKTRRFTCQPARLVLNKTPAFANLHYNSSATFRGPACIFSKQLGNVTTFSFNGGELKVNLKELKATITTHWLKTITALVDGSNPLFSGLDGIAERVSDSNLGNIISGIGSTSLLDLLKGVVG